MKNLPWDKYRISTVILCVCLCVCVSASAAAPAKADVVKVIVLHFEDKEIGLSQEETYDR